MRQRPRSALGYTLIELLVILTIVGILAVVGVTMLVGNRGSASVRAVMDELEGALISAQRMAVATGQDVTIATQGDWTVGSSPMILAMTSQQKVAPADIITNGLIDPSSFKLACSQSSGKVTATLGNHAYAGVVSALQPTWWTIALQAPSGGTANPDPKDIEPFKSMGAFQASGGGCILTASGDNLFQGGAAAGTPSATAPTPGVLTISGSSRRFTSTAFIEVVGLRGGISYPGAPMGILVVLANGSTVYKFYNPGTAAGDGKWRKI